VSGSTAIGGNTQRAGFKVAEFKLEVGKPRFGWLIDGDKSTPLVQALLEDTGTRPFGTELPSGINTPSTSRSRSGRIVVSVA
jgi:hypothetical protein